MVCFQELDVLKFIQAAARHASRLWAVLLNIEGLNVSEAAERLGIPAATVKTRYLRARRRLQPMLGPQLSSTSSDKFPFGVIPDQRPAIASPTPRGVFGDYGAMA